jgi:hypothetical protein
LLPEAVQYDEPPGIAMPKVENTVFTNAELPNIVHFLRSLHLNEFE